MTVILRNDYFFFQILNDFNVRPFLDYPRMKRTDFTGFQGLNMFLVYV